MKARKYNSPELQELLDEITPQEMFETKCKMLGEICNELSIEYAESMDLKNGTHEFVNAARDFRYGFSKCLEYFK